MKKYLFYIFAIMMAHPVMAMQITGKVVDEVDNTPLPGASVVLKGSSDRGVATGEDGTFTWNNPSINAKSIIEISFMGYQTKEVRASQNMGTITLEYDVTKLNKVVVSNSDDCTEILQEKDVNIKSAERVKTDKKNSLGKCVPKECSNGYQVNENYQSENYKKEDKSTKPCICPEPRYKESNDQCIDLNKKSCPSDDKNADIAQYDKGGNCIIQSCKNGYQRDAKNNKCTCEAPRYGLVDDQCVKSGDNCALNNVEHVAKAKYEFDKQTNKMICTIKNCDKGYLPNEDGTACEQSSGDCTPAQILAIEHATKGELRGIGTCVPTECETGYRPNSKTRVCDKEDPKLSPEDQANKVAELQENYNNMKANEQSAASRAAGTIGIGATGFGGMELASAIAEQNADAAAERDMVAYLATFVCDYGQGRFIKGGEADIELPGANALLPLRQEYVALAARLKTQKEALDLLPGIESEEIMDKATMGLYDNESLGKTDGAYTSLYRAMTDETSADAAEWADQKSDTKTQLNVGIGLVAGGIVGSAAINLIGNRNAPKENSAEINAEYAKKLQEIVAQTATAAAQLKPDKKCSDFTGATGDYPTCTCRDKNKQYFFVEEGCVTCEGDLVVVDGYCVCPPDKPNQTGTSCAAPASNNCKLTKYVATGKCECIANATETNNTCECNNGLKYNETQGACIAETVASTTPDATAPATVAPTNQEIASFTIYSDAMFESGSAKIDNTKARALVTDFGKKLADVKTESTANADAIDNQQYCINITGHTDKVPFKKTASGMNNQKLSQQRADAIKDILTSQAGLSSENIHTSGVADRDCDKSGNQPDCRKVEVSLTAGACGAI